MSILKAITLTLNDFASCQWDKVIYESDNSSCEDYYRSFFEKSREAETTGDERSQEVFTLLGAISSMRLNPENTDVYEPYMYLSEDHRGFRLDDFSEQHLAVLGELAPSISDADLRGRVADLVWERKRQFGMVEIAAKAYLESAIKLLKEDSFCRASIDRFERALQLSVYTRQESLKSTVAEQIYKTLENNQAHFKLILNLTRLLLKYRQLNADRSLPLVQTAINKAAKNNDWFAEGALWDILASLYQSQSNIEQESAAQVNSLETHVKVAKYYAENPPFNYHAATFQLSKAIEGYRNIGGMQERSKELHKRLLEYQAASSKQDYERIVLEVDNDFLGDLPSWFKQQVKGHSLSDALIQLASAVHINKVNDLRAQVEHYKQEFVYLSFFPQSMADSEGKKIAAAPAMLSDDLEEVEKAIIKQMYREALMRQRLKANVAIMPMIEQIYLEHGIRMRDLHFIVRNNPFIPNGHENLYVQGLYYGFAGDFVIATHLLLPQLESSLRHILNQRGIVTSSLDTKTGIQENYRLSALLTMPEITEILGEDIVFELRGLLIERFGSNLRNNVLHGLLPASAFYYPEMVYLWWLTLRLCFHGIQRPQLD